MGTLGIVYNETMVDGAPERGIVYGSQEYRIYHVTGGHVVPDSGNSRLQSQLQGSSAVGRRQWINSTSWLKYQDIGGRSEGLHDSELTPLSVLTFSGEASQMLEKNPNLKYVVPTGRPAFSGLITWIHSKTVKNQRSNLYAFIDLCWNPKMLWKMGM